MPIGDVCIRDVTVARKEMTVREAAQIMRRNHVGDLVVVTPTGTENTGDQLVPVGIITDRDIVVSVVGTGLDPGV